MWPSAVTVFRIVKRTYTMAGRRTRHAYCELAILAREAIRSWVEAEVLIEASVLLHDDDDVLDLLQSGMRIGRCARRGYSARGAARRKRDRRQHHECDVTHDFRLTPIAKRWFRGAVLRSIFVCACVAAALPYTALADSPSPTTLTLSKGTGTPGTPL